jgi:hypothetical protein
MQMRRFFTLLEDIEARRKGFRIWFAVVFAWSIARSILVSHIFRKYGLNPWLYFLIDFLSSIPYAYASGKSLLSFIDKNRKHVIWWGFLAVISFYAPDIYIVYISKEVPTATYIGFGVVLAGLSILAIAQWRQSRNSKLKS